MQRTGFWAAVRATLYSFWICRLSVLSVLFGWLLLSAVPQAQAVFFDLHMLGIGYWHWFAFYVAIFVFWMLPVQLSTRVMLHAAEDRFQEGHTTWFSVLMVHLPWLLALACLASVAAGQYVAFDHIPDIADRKGRPLDEVAYTQLVSLLRATLVLMAVWLFAWVVLPRLIHRLTVRSGLLDIWLFRFIATVIFGRRATTRTYDTNATPPRANSAVGRFSPQQLQTAWAAVSLFAIWVLSLILVFRSPLDIRTELSRAPMIPVLVGAWLPVLTFLVYCAHRFRLPILAAFVLLMAIVANSVPGIHDMRIVTQGPQLQARQPTLEEALKWWRKANGCAPTLECRVRPIIVAAEGGASRAAFFTGSILAQLEDLSDPAPTDNTPGAVPFSRQLFAVSTVSGSSLGAAVFAALREDARGGAWPRPEPELANNALWFKSGKALGVGGMPIEPLPSNSTRKDVLQQITAGDFLTPAVAALSLDIWVPWHAKYYHRGDRTYFLERSWEQRFADPSGRTRRETSTFDRALSSLAPDENTWRPLLIFNGTSITTGRRIITSTLYPLFKSPDDASIVESIFRDSYDTYDLMCDASAPATGGACTCVKPSTKTELQPLRMAGCDVGLSTAVSNSARFPIISSHGDIKAVGQKLVDRIADGGYFDYSGIVSALELQAQITRLDDNLRPFVLFVTNDPGFNPRACQQGREAVDELDVLRRPAALPLTPIPARLFSDLAYPLDALLSTRVARSEQAMAQAVLLNRYENVRRFGFPIAPGLLASLRSGRQSYLTFDVISVGARCNEEKQVRPIPLNWWLAMPTQAYLDDEICAEHNQGSMAGVLSQLGVQPERDDYERLRERYDNEKTRVRKYCEGRGASTAGGRQTR